MPIGFETLVAILAADSGVCMRNGYLCARHSGKVDAHQEALIGARHYGETHGSSYSLFSLSFSPMNLIQRLE